MSDAPLSFFAAPEQWDRVAAALLRSADRGDSVGLDTEFYGVGEKPFNIRKESCAGGRVRVHVWSIAIKRWPHVLHPRGYHVSDACVLLSTALEHKGLRDWLESPRHRKVVHNLPVDAHALAGSGVQLRGAVNTLDRARWAWPGRARVVGLGGGYSLDALGTELLGAGKAESWDELFGTTNEVVMRHRTTKVTTCDCGLTNCRKRKGHVKTITEVSTPVLKQVFSLLPLESVVLGHPRWERLVNYSARDAILALGVEDRIEREMQRSVPWPWS